MAPSSTMMLGAMGTVVVVALVAAATGLRGCATPSAGVVELELRGLRLVALRERAAAEGVGAEDLERLLDEEDPKAALVRMLLERADGEVVEGVDTLRAMWLSALRAKALAEGVDAATLEDALDAEDPKRALVELVVAGRQRAPASGPEVAMLVVLQRGGEPAALAIGDVLEQALVALEQSSLASPRKAPRKALLELMARVEGGLDTIDASWADALSRCSDDDLQRASALLAACGGSRTENAAAAASELLGCLERCVEHSTALETPRGPSSQPAQLRVNHLIADLDQ
jgi:hypothetical protein